MMNFWRSLGRSGPALAALVGLLALPCAVVAADQAAGSRTSDFGELSRVASSVESWIKQLGAADRDEQRLAAAAIERQGAAALEPLLDAMGHDELAVRVRAEQLWRRLAAGSPGFDPWALPAERRAKLDELRHWLARQTPQTLADNEPAPLDEADAAVARAAIARVRTGDAAGRRLAALQLQSLGRGVLPMLREAIAALPGDDTGRAALSRVRWSVLLPVSLMDDATLLDALTSDQAHRRSGMVATLVRGDAVLALMELLTDKDPQVRKDAVAGIATVGDQRGLTALAKYLGQADAATGVVAAGVLAQRGHALGVAYLGKAIKSPDWSQRAAAAEALGEVDPASALPLLLGALDDADAYVAGRVLESLSKLRRPVPAMRLRAAAARHPQLGPLVMGVLVAHQSHDRLALVMTMDDAADATQRLALVEKAAQLGPAFAQARDLSPMLDHWAAADEADIRLALTHLLTFARMEDAARLVGVLLDDTDAHVRQGAARVLVAMLAQHLGDDLTLPDAPDFVEQAATWREKLLALAPGQRDIFASFALAMLDDTSGQWGRLVAQLSDNDAALSLENGLDDHALGCVLLAAAMRDDRLVTMALRRPVMHVAMLEQARRYALPAELEAKLYEPTKLAAMLQASDTQRRPTAAAEVLRWLATATEDDATIVIDNLVASQDVCLRGLGWFMWSRRALTVDDPRWRQAIQSDEPAVRRAALLALVRAKSDPKQKMPALARWLDDRNPDVAQLAAGAMLPEVWQRRLGIDRAKLTYHCGDLNLSDVHAGAVTSADDWSRVDDPTRRQVRELVLARLARVAWLSDSRLGQTLAVLAATLGSDAGLARLLDEWRSQDNMLASHALLAGWLFTGDPAYLPPLRQLIMAAGNVWELQAAATWLGDIDKLPQDSPARALHELIISRRPLLPD